jgi:hypothetical protein
MAFWPPPLAEPVLNSSHRHKAAMIWWRNGCRYERSGAVTSTDYARKLDEIDRLLNDPDVTMEPARVWSLLAEISQQDVPAGALGD